MINRKLNIGLYRNLYRLAKKYDKNPQAKFLIHKKPTVTTPNIEERGLLYYHRLFNRLLGDNLLLHPTSNVSFVRILQEEARRSDTNNAALGNPIDTAFQLVKKLNSLYSYYQSILPQLQSSNRMASSSSSSLSFHPIVGYPTDLPPSSTSSTTSSSPCTTSTANRSIVPTKGMLLVAHPLVPGPLHRTVILLLEHDGAAIADTTLADTADPADTTANKTTGAYGLVINRPTPHRLQEAVQHLPETLLAQHGERTVAFGGLIRRLQVLHRRPELQGSCILPAGGEEKSSPPLYAGGRLLQLQRGENKEEKAKEEAEGEAKGEDLEDNKKDEDEGDYTFFAGCCCWAPGQLEQELQHGYWQLVRCEDNLAEVLALLRSEKEEEGEEEVEQEVDGRQEVQKGEPEIAETEQLQQQQQQQARRLERISEDIYQAALRAVALSSATPPSSPLPAAILDLPPWLDASCLESIDM